MMSSLCAGSWWNSASCCTPHSAASHTAYSTVQWPHVLLSTNSDGVYCASWISRSASRHSSSAPGVAANVPSTGIWWSLM